MQAYILACQAPERVSDLHEGSQTDDGLSRGSPGLWTAMRCALTLGKRAGQERYGCEYPRLRLPECRLVSPG